MITTRPLKDVFQTAAEMRRLSLTYWADLGRWLDASFIDYFNYICALPYVSDPEQVETISRPAYTLKEGYRPRDCDDKAVLIACWCVAHKVPVKFVAVSTQENRELNHVFCNVDGVDVDATYNCFHGIIGNYPYFSDVTAREDLTGYF